jgi:RNA polymerase sigma factor (sigma-70 family)
MTGPAERLLRHVRQLASPPGQAPASDAELLARFVCERDEGAFAALVRRYGGLVLGACRRVLCDPHEAEDAFQAVWLVLARKAGEVRPAGLAAWLHGVARQVSLNSLRANARRRRALAGARCEPVSVQPGLLDELAARELLAVLDEEVQRLPGAVRLVVVLCCLEGLSQEEAAHRLGCTPGSVKGRLERGRRRLHERLARRGLSLSAVLGAAEVARVAGNTTPVTLPASTAGAAMLFAAGQGARGATSAGAAALAKGVLRAMWVGKMKFVAATVLALGLMGAALALLPGPGRAGPSRVPATAEQPADKGGLAARDDGSKLLSSLLALEKAGWEALKKPDVGAVKERTAEDFVAITADGKRLGRTEFLRELGRVKLKKSELSEARLTRPGEGSAVLTYRARAEYTAEGGKFKEDLWVSSTWALRGGKWVGVAYQETPALARGEGPGRKLDPDK